MKPLKLVFLALLFGATQLQAQLKIDQITYKAHDYFIANKIGYPIEGIYLYEGKAAPITQLNGDGTGIFQYEDLSKKNISWGIECTDEGIPIFKEGFNSATYTFWYKPENSTEWMHTQFSIHFNKKKMFIMGERVKDYSEDPEPKK